MNIGGRVKPRPYRSALRQAKAGTTRARILQAAQQLFLANGYVATSVEAIAAAAGVAAETVYLHFKTKPRLIAALLDVALVGDDAPAALLERAWMQSVLRIPDSSGRVRALARNTRQILDRLGPIHGVMRGAATVEPEIAEMARAHARRRLEGQATLVEWIAEPSGLRHGLTKAEATQHYFALTSPELHHLFTQELGWSGRRYEEWLARALTAELLQT